MYDLGCMFAINRDPLWYSIDYRVYMGSSMIVRLLRRLPLYLCSYKLDGSVIVSSDVKVQVRGRKGDFSTVDTSLLFFLLGSHRSDTLVCNPSAQYCFVSTSLNMFTNFIYENQT